jgi:hypothetical protein
VSLQGAAVRVLFVLWSLVAAGCRCKVLYALWSLVAGALQGVAGGCCWSWCCCGGKLRQVLSCPGLLFFFPPRFQVQKGFGGLVFL